jgi:cbb3-type cytochrome oxidase maturation protein
MSIIYILIPIAVLLTCLGIYLFFWAVKTEQFDDLEKQGMSILFDEDVKTQDTNSEVEQDTKLDNSNTNKDTGSVTEHSNK